MGEDQVPDTGERPAAPSSPLARIRAQRKAGVDALHVDLAVPRYDPPVWVRFKPITQALSNELDKRYGDKNKDPEKDVIGNAVGLTRCCLGIFDDPDSDPESWPKFDERLAALLDMPADSTPVQLVRALYFTDGDIMSVAAELVKWSGYSVDAVEERTAGN